MSTTPQLPDDPRTRLVSAPEQYGYALEGQGRWAWLGPARSGERRAVLYTDDADVLGVLAAADTVEAVTLANQVRTGLWAAKAAGTPASTVFDAYAARDGQGLACLEVETGDLATLPSRIT